MAKFWDSHASRSAGIPPTQKTTLVTGANANTNIAVAGIKKGQDALVSVIEVPASAALVDRTAACSITSDGNIQCTASTAGNQLIVFWTDTRP